jgi:penicillin-binding protein 2
VGIDFAGKTGSAQTISNAAKARLGGGKQKFKDNGWFVGVTPRRNPEIVVCVLMEEGEHGYLAARVASQVIRAYVEKQRKRALLLAQGHSAEEVLRADLGKIDLPKNVVDRFSPPATVSTSPDKEKPAVTTTELREKPQLAVGDPQLTNSKQGAAPGR